MISWEKFDQDEKSMINNLSIDMILSSLYIYRKKNLVYASLTGQPSVCSETIMNTLIGSHEI